MRILIAVLAAIGLAVWALARFSQLGIFQAGDAVVFIGLALVLGILEKKRTRG
ncbi:MAG TPA: hypothetical protein PK636_08660 [bacterium]|nr:hypothetical protein [bacterium]HPJ72742.1 hypothetical protein [bacterium]HPQ67236.1 hypothetical protein [bacterium]